MTRIAVVVNPSKFDDVAGQRAILDAVCARHGLERPLWFETSEDDPGLGQTRDALAHGADVVCAFGGDGTVRAVGEALAGGDVPLGLLPAGTGNQLAHALGLATGDAAEALETVVTGTDRRIDVCVMRADGGQEQVFLVMAGMGLDAETMDNTDDRLKARVGWPAYILGALRAAAGRGFGVRIDLGQGQTVRRRRARAVIVGNSGRLRGGLQLMPDALLDDGLLDVTVLSPRGLLAWAQTLLTVATAGRRGHRHLERRQATRLRVRAGVPTLTELDGDVIGDHRELEVELRPGALLVRVPRHPRRRQ